MKCGDKIIVMHQGQQLTCEVYGEVYMPKNYSAFTPGPNRLAAIELYHNNVVFEVPVEKVIKHESR
jgi:hypothetical protein